MSVFLEGVERRERDEAPAALLLAAAAARAGLLAAPEEERPGAVAAGAARALDSAGRGRDAASPTRAPAPQIPEEYTKPGHDALARAARRRGAAQQPGDARGLVLRARRGGGGRLEAVAVLSLRRGRRHRSSARSSRPSAASSLSCRRRTGPSVAAPGCSSISARGRRTSQEATRALYAADWTHNAAIQDVVLQVAQAYYQYLNAKAQVAARAGEPRGGAAQPRRGRGAPPRGRRDDRRRAAGEDARPRRRSSTCRSPRARSRSSAARSRRRSASRRRCRSTSGSLPEELPLDAVTKSVDELIARAIAERPDLAAQRFRRWRPRATSRPSAVEGLPKLSLDAAATGPSTTRPGSADPFSTN